MKKLVKTILASMMLVSALTGCTSSSTSASTSETTTALPKIGVIQLVEHTSLNMIYDSFEEELKTLGYVDGENCVIEFQNAQGEIANITSIVQTFAGDKKDVVVGIATPVAQGMMPLAKDTPVIFSAVTDPVSAGLVKDLNDTSGNITGTSDAVQVDQIMDLALEFFPDAKTVGYIYNPGEDNSVSNLGLLKEYASAKGLTVEETSIATSADLQTAAATLCQKVDMIFVANDNTVAEAMPVLAQESIKANVPVFTGADSMVMDGGLATVGIDYSDLGKETAQMVDKVLKGTPVSEIPVKVFKDDLFIYVNTDTANALGIKIPAEVSSNEKYVEIKK